MSRSASVWLLVLALAGLVPDAGAAQEGDPWEPVLERVVPAVVALRVSATRSFDTSRAAVSVATGFVVDAERGLILTNRHVVQPGPVTAEAVFLDHEKVVVEPIYRDPVHDFGLFRFDPAQIRFMDVRAIALAPEQARIGAEIRVVGNDAGEKLSILSGTLARLDRDAPSYGRDRYNDFNTFYFQAASGTSGGSSGSPVLDRRGRAIALNAGGNRGSASSFFLPLDRVVRALEAVQDGRPVSRGTVQATFKYRAFDELQRLGLQSATEASVRSGFPGATGLLVVESVVPQGPAEGRLEPGDVLVSLNGRALADFVTLEGVLDESVGSEVRFGVERGGAPFEVAVEVADLHAITPAAYLEWSGAVLHALSYQQARSFSLPVQGVTLSTPGFAFQRARVPGRAILLSVGGRPVPDLDSLETALASLPDRARVPVEYLHPSEPRRRRVSLLEADRRWFPMQHCTRDDATGNWPCRASPPPPSPPEPKAVQVELSDPRLPKVGRRLASSLAFVEFDVPYKIDGVYGASFSGAGVVVDAERGLVVVDRDTVPVSLGDVRLTFARSVTVPGRVVALHPEHGLAVVGYDPSRLAGSGIESARLRTGSLENGESLWLVGFSPRQQTIARQTEVVRIAPARLPLPRFPRFREMNLDIATVSDPGQTVGGVLADGRGRVRALWASISRDERGKPRAGFGALPADLIEELIAPLREDRAFEWSTLGIELGTLSVADARARGLSEVAAHELEEHDPGRRRVLEVLRVVPGLSASASLRPGDLILAANGAAVTRFREIERAAAQGRVSLRVLQEGEERELSLEPTRLDAIGTRNALVWGGALLQPVPLEARAQRALPAEGVYVTGRWYGSPAERHDLRATRRIVAVDDEPTPDLPAFERAVAAKRDRDSVRLRTLDLEGRERVLTLELDLRFWPTAALEYTEQGWTRRELPLLTEVSG